MSENKRVSKKVKTKLSIFFVHTISKIKQFFSYEDSKYKNLFISAISACVVLFLFFIIALCMLYKSSDLSFDKGSFWGGIIGGLFTFIAFIFTIQHYKNQFDYIKEKDRLVLLPDIKLIVKLDNNGIVSKKQDTIKIHKTNDASKEIYCIIQNRGEYPAKNIKMDIDILSVNTNAIRISKTFPALSSSGDQIIYKLKANHNLSKSIMIIFNLYYKGILYKSSDNPEHLYSIIRYDTLQWKES